jgi:hypothetical protein
MKYFNIKMLLAGVLLAFGTTMVSSCKKDEFKEAVDVDKIATNKGLSPMKFAGDGRFDLLGCGYDITGRFAHPISGRSEVVNTERLFADNNDNIRRNLSSSTDYEQFFGSNASEFINNLTQKYNLNVSGIAKWVGFKAEVKSTFTNNDSVTSKHAYAKISKNIRRKQFAFTVSTELLRSQYLNDKFIQDVETRTPADLVALYGTHVLADITLGGKLDVQYRSETNSSRRLDAVIAGAVVNGMWKTFSLDVDVNYKHEELLSNFNQTLQYSTVGGDISRSLNGEINLDNSVPAINIANWESGLNDSNVALIEIGQNGFIPLWEFISDPAKRNAVEAYITQYIINNQLVMGWELLNVYEYYHQGNNDHYFTTGRYLDSDSWWRFQGEKFRALKDQAPGSIPAYRYYATKVMDHVILVDLTHPLQNPSYWNDGGEIVFYVYPNQVSGTIPVYQYYDDKGRDHILAAATNIELISYLNRTKGWVNEGVLFYAYPN